MIVSIESIVSAGSFTITPVVVLEKLGVASAGHELRAANLRAERRNQQCSVRRVEYVDVDAIAFARRHTPRMRRDRAAAGAVNGVAVLAQPRAHLAQPRGELRLDLAVGHRADVEQEVRVRAGRPDEIANRDRGSTCSVDR